MKKVLLMIAAALLLMTQCRKNEMSAVMPEANTVKMTVTVGSGSKTHITDEGAITWSMGDKLYVGNGSKCIGCLTITEVLSDGKVGTFSGDVTLSDGTTGEQEFGFFYLGNCNSIAWNPQNTVEGFQNTDETEPWLNATSATVVFSGQSGKLDELEKFHIGYGDSNLKEVVNETGKVEISGIVSMESKVALDRFSFKNGGASYTNELTLNGDNIFNKMTVNFNENGFSFSDTKGNITLGSGNAERYVMLVPTDDNSDVTLSFASGDKTGVATIKGGIQPNMFYGMGENAIVVNFNNTSGGK